MTAARISPAEIATALGLAPPTAEQSAVIGAPAAPSLVIAGAGAGKTETMAARVVWLVAGGIVAPQRVLGLTFTRKAAGELAARIRARLASLARCPLLHERDPDGAVRAEILAGEPTVLTYHAYAGRLVAEHGLRLPAEPGARLLTETAAWQLAHRVVTGWDGDLDTELTPPSLTSTLCALAGEIGEHLVSPEALRRAGEQLCARIEAAPPAPRQRLEMKRELAEILASQRLRAQLVPLVEEYSRRKRAAGAMDFADEMSLAAALARGHPEVARLERDRFGAVLLDEYQDTGHAQRVLLTALFAASGQPGPALPITAVGDPAQAIYGWRGASAANLPRFADDFAVDGAPAPRSGLSTSFRSPQEVLTLAGVVAEPLVEAGLPVERLRARDGAPPGEVRLALPADVEAERGWLADEMHRRWHGGIAAGGTPPTAAVLVRRRAEMGGIAAALRERGLPVEVVGLGGLLDEPEVRDLTSALRVLVDPLAGTAAMRLLTGSRWRLGAADLAALHHRARELAAGAPSSEGGELAGVDLAAALPAETAEQVGLVDAVDDPGEAGRYSGAGAARIAALGAELAMLRGKLDAPLPELVAEVQRSMLLDIEVAARPGETGRAHLDAFADVVAEFAASSPDADTPALLDYLDAAAHRAGGLEPADVEVAEDRVQVLTVHSAKGLEWQLVAVPHLVDGVFPAGKRASCWLRTVMELPVALRGDAADLPSLELPADADQKELAAACQAHDEAFDERRELEERRLCYVALTRSAGCLLVSGYRWGETAAQPREPSTFLTELAGAIEDDPRLGTIDQWEPEPDPGAANPLSAETRTASWPADPLGNRREAIEGGAALVLAELDQLESPGETDAAGDPAVPEAPDDPDGWARDVTALLAERAATAPRGEVALPDALSVSQLVELARDPDSLARRLARPLPRPPESSARRGSAFHAWLERRFDSEALLELDELPGSADVDRAEPEAEPDAQLAELQRRFLAGPWASRNPHAVEVPFETRIDGYTVRGRMDAVFADADGGWTVVDWKTGAAPDENGLRPLALQLSAYRLAWSALSGTPLSRVRAVLYYVRAGRTVAPEDLLDSEGLRELLRSVPTAAGNPNVGPDDHPAQLRP
jgi:DNA helicase-2/ATP-dependent DNA helicase PcrA